jgi:hypothetical protein
MTKGNFHEFEKEANAILKHYSSRVKPLWDARESILAMKDEGYRQWKQMEWTGFFFEFLCKRYAPNFLSFPGKRYGRVGFDCQGKYPWDIKAHAINTSSHEIIVNDREAIESALREYGVMGLFLASGDVEYNDDKRTFQKWHAELKGKKSEYEKEREKRGAWSRRRKVAFRLVQLAVIRIDDALIRTAGSFQVGFRNANGTPRREKVLVDLEKLEGALVAYHDF